MTLEQIGGVGADKESASSAYVQVRVSPPQRGINVWLHKATNEKGEEIYGAGYGERKNGLWMHWFQQSSRAVTMNLTFVVHKTHFIEFEAKPISMAP